MNELVGAWKLKEAKWTFDDGEAVDLYGPGAEGRLLFTTDGWMAALIMNATATPPMTLAYSGKYRLEAGQFVTEVDVSSLPMWLGTEQARAYELAGDVLTIKLGMPVHPSYPGRPGRGTLGLSRE